MKRYMRITITMVLICALTIRHAAYASEQKTAEYTPISVEELSTEEGQNKVYAMNIETNQLTGWPQGPGTYGESAIIMEAKTGAVLYAKNADAKFYPASITKLLTVLTALENGKLEDKVTFSNDSLAFLEPGDAYIGMKEGNVITLEQAIHAILMASANEVSYATGESVGKNAGKDYKWFLEQMNGICKRIGAENSHFSNTNGLHADDHYTTARDMALISRELFKYPKAFEVMQTYNYQIPASKTTEEHVFQQNHKMLVDWSEYYNEQVIGGKTGFTDQALSTLVTMADNGEMQLICVLLRTLDVRNVYPDTNNLFNYGFTNFKKISAKDFETSKEIKEILDDEENNGMVMLPEGIEPQSLEMEIVPDEEGDKATLEYTYEGNCVGKVRALLKKDEAGKARDKKTEKKENTPDTDEIEDAAPGIGALVRKIAIVSAVIVLILFILWLRFYLGATARRRRRRRRQGLAERRRAAEQRAAEQNASEQRASEQRTAGQKKARAQKRER